MATPWIKMRTDLLEDPRVGRMSFILGCSPTHVIGCLYVLWSLADKYSVDGQIPHLTTDALDARVGLEGFSDALRVVEWLETPESGSEAPSGLVIPRFNEHNGQSAKRRSQDASRKASVRKVSAPKADGVRNRAEQSRKETDKEFDSSTVVKVATANIGSGSNDQEISKKIMDDPRFRRSFEILTEKGLISNTNVKSCVGFLLDIDKSGRDPLAILTKIIDSSKTAVNKGGYVFSALRNEAKN